MHCFGNNLAVRDGFDNGARTEDDVAACENAGARGVPTLVGGKKPVFVGKKPRGRANNHALTKLKGIGVSMGHPFLHCGFLHC